MEIPYKALLYDLDGTLVNSQEDLIQTVRQTLLHFNLQLPSNEAIISYIGGGLEKLLRSSLGDQQQLYDKAYEFFSTYYKAHLLDQTQLYPFIKEILHTCHIRGFSQAVVTNKRVFYTEAILEGLQIASYFATVTGGDTLNVHKPSPELILHTLEILNIRPDQALMIGDNDTDIEAAYHAGVKSCYFKGGIGSLGSIQPDFQVETLNELKPLLGI
jgi:2-phosphoglycolate phosphatase